jgi:hypothetical protein
MTAADAGELTRSTRELMLKEAIDMARDKGTIVLEEKMDPVAQDQETFPVGKELAVVKNQGGGTEASQATVHEKRTSKL